MTGGFLERGFNSKLTVPPGENRFEAMNAKLNRGMSAEDQSRIAKKKRVGKEKTMLIPATAGA